MATTIKVNQIEGSTGSTVTVPTGQTLVMTDGLAQGSLPTVTVAKGGTNLTSFTAGDVLYATGSTTLAKLAKGTASQQIAMNAGATAPEWITDVGSSSIVTTGALDSGSITSGFGAIDNGTSNIRSATITAETAFVPDASGGADLGTTALEFNDLFLNDDGSIQFGDDQDTTLVHTDGTGLTLNSTNKLCFNDASQFVQGSSATVLSIGATDEIDLTATAIDINGTCDVSGTLTNASTAVKVAGTETMFIPAQAMFGTTTNGADAQAVETTATRPEIKVLDFDASTAEYAQFSIAMPKSWNLGTVTYQVFWSPGNTDTGNCIFGLQGLACTEGDTADAVFGTAIEVTDAGIGTVEDVQMSAVSSAVTIGGSPADDDYCFFQLYRDAADGSDTFTGDARVMGVKLFYTTDAANDA